MAFDIASFRKVATEKIEWLSKELQGVRTGRATPTLLDGVSLEVYGSRMKLKEVGSIAVQDARTLYITPWDISQAKAIEKAIMVADLGISVGADDKGVRVSFPELTTERRGQLTKLVHAKLEEARVSVRGERARAIGELEKSGVSEDEEKRLKAEIQKAVDDVNTKLEDLAKKKEHELNS